MRARRVLLRLAIAYIGSCIILAIILAELAFHPKRREVNGRAIAEALFGEFGAPLQDVSISASDGAKLQAWFGRPAHPNGDDVILLHGVGDNREGMLGYARLLLSHGYGVLISDSRAHGLSGGESATYGIKEAGDVRDWYEWLRTFDHPNCVFGMGESMGAAIVLQSLKTTLFCAVVAESSFADFRQIAFIRVGQLFHTGSWLGKSVLRPAVELAFVYGRITRGVNLAAASPEQSVVGSYAPILLIHGLADTNIPARQSELIRDHNPVDIVLWEVPNAGHCGAASEDPIAFNARVVGWFVSHSKVPPVSLQP